MVLITHRTKVVTEQLKLLHYKFDVGTMDTAFVCQRHYAQVLINEFGLNGFNGTPKATEPVDKIVSDSTSFLKK